MGTGRFWEVDAARGAAVLAMIIYHLFFDLSYFGVAAIAVTEGLWAIFARCIAVTFIFVAGVSLAITRWRHPLLSHGSYLIRGLKIAACGLGITIATWLFVPDEFIFFGILHMIGIGIMLAPFFIRLGMLNLLIGIAIIIAGHRMNDALITMPWLAWLGIPYYGMATLDWFPLFPWFGVMLIGIAIGGFLYPFGKPRWDERRVGKLGKKTAGRAIAWIGRHSLAIYLIHQPALILAVLLLSGKIAGFL